jgi:hypothetical protein
MFEGGLFSIGISAVCKSFPNVEVDLAVFAITERNILSR